MMHRNYGCSRLGAGVMHDRLEAGRNDASASNSYVSMFMDTTVVQCGSAIAIRSLAQCGPLVRIVAVDHPGLLALLDGDEALGGAPALFRIGSDLVVALFAVHTGID